MIENEKASGVACKCKVKNLPKKETCQLKRNFLKRNTCQLKRNGGSIIFRKICLKGTYFLTLLSGRTLYVQSGLKGPYKYVLLSRGTLTSYSGV